MKQIELTRWLKAMILICAVIVLGLCFVLIPIIDKNMIAVYDESKFIFWPFLIFVWVTAVPFSIALWHAWHIVSEISKDNSFCPENAKRLKKISKLALLESFFYLGGIVYLLAMGFLFTGVLLVASLIVFIGILLTVACAVLSHLVEKASDMKQDQDLTI